MKWIYNEVIRVALSDPSFYYLLKNIKKTGGNKKYRTSGTPLDEEVQLPDWSYSVSDIQIRFKYIIKKNKTVTDILLIQI